MRGRDLAFLPVPGGRADMLYASSVHSMKDGFLPGLRTRGFSHPTSVGLWDGTNGWHSFCGGSHFSDAACALQPGVPDDAAPSSCRCWRACWCAAAFCCLLRRRFVPLHVIAVFLHAFSSSSCRVLASSAPWTACSHLPRAAAFPTIAVLLTVGLVLQAGINSPGVYRTLLTLPAWVLHPVVRFTCGTACAA